MVFLVHRRADLSAEEFSKYWRESHSAIAKTLPGLRKYIQNHAEPAADGTNPPFDGFAEMWFDDVEALNAALATEAGNATVADTENFIDLDSMLTFSVEEVNVV